MPVFVKKSFALLLGLLSLMSCSRPSATFQPAQRERFLNRSSNWVEGSYFSSATVPDTMEALIRNDGKLIVEEKAVQQRFRHSRKLLMTSSENVSIEPSKTNEPRRITGVQRFLLKKISKRLSRQSTPDKPTKTALVEGILVLGAVLLLGGVLLVLLTSGTGFAIGVIALAAGLVCLLVGLL